MCRVLIAAVALTCTLSHDLMCILLLSGMQKEHLDGNLLTKLQRHNVNIEDMNNAKLLQACVQSRDNNSDDKFTNITETQPFNQIKSKSIFLSN
ncbi:uncharacterized protein LOC120631985 [Pararge aegeria]|uniref:uncharacterized protein LOC120631985 n=1 Tax=Pararge aegeria TaxID=116150 RepID=UPI0019D05D14|nr:uncharacterized protein LOC120631985 [Pararge aegeria]